MDNIKDILSSDLLERYILGDVSQEERMQVELLCIDHRVIREKIDELEKVMEHTAVQNAVKAPEVVKECIIKNLHGKGIQKTNQAQTTTYPRTSVSGWKIAASIIAVCLGTWAVMQSQLNKAQKTITDLNSELEIMHRDCDRLTKQYAFLNHTNTLPVLLEGPEATSDNQVVVYWNEFLQQSMLRVIELPGITADETYQLWADVDGEMLSLGIFDANQAVTDAISMSFLDNATSLNITIEPKGGSEHPDVSRLTVTQAI